MRNCPLLLPALLCWSLLTACAQQPVAPEQEPTEEPTRGSPAPVSPAPAQAAPSTEAGTTRSFTSETLYALLAAEIASNRGRLDIALANYYQQAYETRDPQVAARATLYARYLNANQMALETSLLWVEITPEDSEAQLSAALALMQAGRLQEAFTLSRELQQKGEHTLFQNIAANAASLTDTQRESLLHSYQALLESYPDDEQLLIGTGLLLQQQDQAEAALQHAKRVLKLYPDSTAGAILEATTLHQLGQYEEALASLANLVEAYPDNDRLRLQYARLLTQSDLESAQEQFEILVEQSPSDGDLLLPLGIIALERGDHYTAANAFEELLDLDQHTSTAHFYLGQIAESEGQLQSALMHYLQVQSGPDFLPATLKIIDIFVRQEDLVSADQYVERMRARLPDQAEGFYYIHAQALVEHGLLAPAEKVLSEALIEYPESSQLLYSRAMLYDNQGDLEKTERDLRALLKYDPNNAHALNALGYILTDRTDRHEEAFELISKALAIMPDEAAVIDSMGWVHYHLGNYPEAIRYLERAMAAHPDHEIAAHLGEVLWVTGAHREAENVWQQGLELNPESPIIHEAMERLKNP